MAGLVLTKTGFSLKMTAFVLNLTGFVSVSECRRGSLSGTHAHRGWKSLCIILDPITHIFGTAKELLGC